MTEDDIIKYNRFRDKISGSGFLTKKVHNTSCIEYINADLHLKLFIYIGTNGYGAFDHNNTNCSFTITNMKYEVLETGSIDSGIYEQFIRKYKINKITL